MPVDDLTLVLTRGVGPRTISHRIDIYGSAEAIFEVSKDELVERARLRPEIAERIVRREAKDAAAKELEYCRSHDLSVVVATDDSYPKLLREVDDCPHVLFVRGNVKALSQRHLSMVGTRNISPAGKDVCNRIVQQLGERVDDLCIVSGLAYGVDAACHRASLAYGVNTVAVIASALPSVTPSAHRALADDIVAHGGAIITELHSQSPQNGALFLARNRIIAGMSAGTVVVESPASGGSLATADMADGYHRAVMAIPGRITDNSSFGTNNLIRSGKARLVLTADDIVEDVGWHLSAASSSEDSTADSPLSQLQPSEQMVYSIIADNTTISLAEILERSGLTIGELSMVIMSLELQGLIRKLPGQSYELAWRG